MTARETSLLNAFETTLTGTIGASDSTMTVNAVVDSAGNQIQPDSYLVLNPDSATNREVVLISAVNSGTKQLTIGDGGSSYRYLTGSAASSGLSHASGSVVRMAPLQQHIEDLNDRVDTIINEAGTELKTTLFLDEDNMASNSATKGVTQQSVKAYVDATVTAEHLEVSADSGSNIEIDLDSEVLDIEGGTGIDTATGTNKVTFAIDSTVATLSGSQALTNKTIDVDSNTVSNIEVDNLKSGVLDTDLSSTAGTDTTLPSAKAVKTYVDAQVTAQDLDLISDSGTIDIDLDSESLTVTGGEGIDTSATGTTLTIAGEDATTSNKGVASFSSDNFAVSSGAVTIKDSGVSNDELAGSIANAKLANSSITVTDGSSSTATALGGTITFSGTSNEVEVAESSGTITIGLPATITANVTGNVSGTSGSTTGNAATATALATARTIGGVSFDGTGDINLPGVNTAGNQNTSGTAADLSATLDETKGGTGLTSFTTGDVIYASGSNTLAKLGIGSSGNVLSVSSGGIVEWTAPTTGDITAVNTASNSGLAGGDTSGAVSLTVDPSNLTDGTGVTVDTSADFLIMEDVTDGTVYKVNPDQIASGSANQLAAGNSDFTLTDTGTATGIHYELDNVDTADWNQGGIALTSVGGIFRHSQTQDSTYTVASTEGAVVAGPISIGSSATVTIAGTMVIL